MATSPENHPITCPNCGADLRQEYTACPACGAPLSPERAASQRREKVLQMITQVNQNLVQAGSGAAESAFGLGCSLGTLIGVFLMAVLFLLGYRNWILLGIIAMGLAVAAAGVSAAISIRAKSATIAGTYDREVEPEIKDYLQSNRMTRQEFDSLADEALDNNAPLRRYLSPASGGDLAPSENGQNELKN